MDLFADRLVQLMNDYELRLSMGMAGQKKSQYFQIESVGQKWKQLFDELMKPDEV